EAAGARHVAALGAAVVLEGGRGVAEEGRAAGALGVLARDGDRERAVLAVLEPRLGEVPLHEGAGDGVLLEVAADVPGGGAQLGHLLGALGGGGDGTLGGLLGRLLGGLLRGGLGAGRRAVALVLLLVGGEQGAGAQSDHEQQDQGEHEAAAAGDQGPLPAAVVGIVLVLGRSADGWRGRGGALRRRTRGRRGLLPVGVLLLSGGALSGGRMLRGGGGGARGGGGRGDGRHLPGRRTGLRGGRGLRCRRGLSGRGRLRGRGGAERDHGGIRRQPYRGGALGRALRGGRRLRVRRRPAHGSLLRGRGRGR